MTATPDLPARGLLHRINLRGVLLFAALIAVALPVFWMGLGSLGRAWITPEYSHGPLIPLISLYLFLRERHQIDPVTGEKDPKPGLALIAVSLALGVFGNLIAIPDVVTYALILWTGGVMLTVLGWQDGKRHWAPILHLIFMLPLPQILYWQLTIQLQLISSELGVWFIRLADIPVFLEGNIIDLGVYKLQVAEACSGLRYLFPILSFSYLMAILYRGPYWHKVVLFALAAPLTVFMNSVRIGIVGMLVNAYGIEHAEGFLHVFEGWVIFGACIALLFLTALGLQKLTRDPKPLRDVVDLDTEGLGGQAAQVLQIALSKGLIMALGLSALITTAFLTAPTPARVTPDREIFATFPRQIGDWSGQFAGLDPEVEEVLGATDYVNATYVSSDARTSINVFAAWYATQTEGDGIHSPEVCLPVGGWEVFSLDATPVSFPATVYGDFQVNRAVIEKGLSRQLVYYWFEQRGKRMTSDYAAKTSVVYDSLTRGRTDGAMVRFVTPIGANEDEAEADARLQAFMGEVLPQLPKFIPE
ncbi:MAG: VPLPA-CTERM-specific exosortase XrtD [Pseudomonadota bacterium]